MNWTLNLVKFILWVIPSLKYSFKTTGLFTKIQFNLYEAFAQINPVGTLSNLFILIFF